MYAWQTVEQAAITLGISTRTIARRIAKTELESRLHNGRREVYIRLPDGYVASSTAESPAPNFSATHSATTTESASDSSSNRKTQTENTGDHRTSSKGEPDSSTHSTADPTASPRDRVHVVTIDGELTGADAPGYQEDYEQTVRQTVAASREGFDIETSAALILAEDRARRAEMAIAVISQSSAIMQNEVRIARSGARWAWGIAAMLFVCVAGSVCWAVAVVTKSQLQAEAVRDKIAAIAEHNQQMLKEQNQLRKELGNSIASGSVAEGQLMEMRQEAEQSKAQIASMTQEAKERAQEQDHEKTRPTLGQKLTNAIFGWD